MVRPVSKLAFPLALLGVACVGEDLPEEGGLLFRCADGQTLTARFAEAHAVIDIRGQSVQLPRVPAESGWKYERDEWLFWVDGEEAALDTPASPPERCTRVVPPKLISPPVT